LRGGRGEAGPHPCQTSLAAATALDLGGEAALDAGEARRGGRETGSLPCAVYEAAATAFDLDGYLEAARRLASTPTPPPPPPPEVIAAGALVAGWALAIVAREGVGARLAAEPFGGGGARLGDEARRGPQWGANPGPVPGPHWESDSAAPRSGEPVRPEPAQRLADRRPAPALSGAGVATRRRGRGWRGYRAEAPAVAGGGAVPARAGHGGNGGKPTRGAKLGVHAEPGVW